MVCVLSNGKNGAQSMAVKCVNFFPYGIVFVLLCVQPTIVHGM